MNKTTPILLNLFDRWPRVDIIIVTPYDKYDKYRKILNKKVTAPIVPITQLVQ
jgi:hypothetical protein